MDKATHQHLRFDLEQDISRVLDDEHLVRQVLDLVMRRVVQEQAAEAVRRQRINRDFKTFRRGRSVTRRPQGISVNRAQPGSSTGEVIIALPHRSVPGLLLRYS
ncbi:hypothetical protein ACIRUG_17850 [Pseudomonas aeruginosa]